jgi:dolichol-phosphate mannosyltransferase
MMSGSLESAPSISPGMTAPELTVVIPTFNERANVSILIGRLHTVLASVAWEVIFVDDDSPDATAALVKAIGEKDSRVRCIRRIKRRGLAGACIEGMLASQAAYVAVIDADLQHDENLLAEMLRVLRSDNADLVIGSRYVAGGEAGGLSQQRHTASRLGVWLARRMLSIDVADPTSGFFMLKRSTIDEIAPVLSTQGFKVLADILSSAPSRLRVRELPYRFRERLHGSSKLDARTAFDFIGLLLSKLTRDFVSIRFVGFLLVGGLGIAVHLVALKASLSLFGLDFTVAQTVATFVSMTSNFFLNNTLTYRDQKLTGVAAVRGLLFFYAICSVGAFSNIGVANWLYANRPVWWLAGLLGSIVSVVWNYAMSTVFVWRTHG